MSKAKRKQKPTIESANASHVEVAVTEPCRVIAFLDVASGKLNLQVYSGTARTHERRVPVAAWEGGGA